MYPTFLNRKSTSINLNRYVYLGAGGLFGGILGGNILDLIDEKYISFIFIVIILFALLRIYFSKHTQEDFKEMSKSIMVMIGLLIGVVSSMLGIGGTIFLIPILVGFFGFNTKNSSVISLFFVTFTSTSSFITLYYLGYVDLVKGSVVALFSMIGVKLGIWATNRVSHIFHKKLVIALYLVLLVIFINGAVYR
jgi:uncharacterized membrane protein YfcA